MARRVVCSGECNIRIDLLLLYPALLVPSVAAAVSAIGGASPETTRRPTAGRPTAPPESPAHPRGNLTTTTANARTLEQANAAVAVGDHEGFLAHCTDDTAWHFVGERTRRGSDLTATYLEPPRFTVTQRIAEGDFVAAIGDIAVTGATGRVTHSAYCDVWRLREGKRDELQAFLVNSWCRRAAR